MASYKDNPETEYVYGTLFSYDFDAEVFPGKDDMEALDSVSTFFEYMYSYAVRCGHVGSASDTDALILFLANRCKEEGIKLGSGTSETIKRWLKSGTPPNSKGARENVYQLCFALKMNAHETAEFFLKAYLERPFNYKEIHEAVYFFCMNNCLNYQDAVRIIAAVEQRGIIPNPDADQVTEEIGERLCEIKTDAALIKYLDENRSGFGVQNQSATDRIRDLVQRCIEIAPKEFSISNLDAKKITVNNIDELLSVIYGYNARATQNAKPVYRKSISKSNFPILIRRNWPQREQFQQILGKRTASYDTIRRALIMLIFYDFYANALVAEKEAACVRRKTGKNEMAAVVSDGLFDEFVTEINTTLAECGYIQLYWRNPFDWMIGYCAMSPDPLETLRDLIDEYYLCDPTVTDQGKDKIVLQE